MPRKKVQEKYLKKMCFYIDLDDDRRNQDQRSKMESVHILVYTYYREQEYYIYLETHIQHIFRLILMLVLYYFNHF